MLLQVNQTISLKSGIQAFTCPEGFAPPLAPIVQKCRYVTKQEADNLLRRAGFAAVRVADGYALDDLHPVGMTEATESCFVCVAATGA